MVDVPTPVDVMTPPDSGDRDVIFVGEGGMCPMGQTNCVGVCVDTNTSAENCGMCGNGCALGQRCSAGMCVNNCGLPGLACCAGNTCDESSQCVMGMCQRTMPSASRPGADLVSAGARLNSTNFRMVSTLGQSSQHQAPMQSTNFRLTGGLIGVIGQ
jgi:hypothetical protein